MPTSRDIESYHFLSEPSKLDVGSLAESVVDQADRYLEAIDNSIQTATDGCTFANDALCFYESLMLSNSNCPPIGQSKVYNVHGPHPLTLCENNLLRPSPLHLGSVVISQKQKQEGAPCQRVDILQTLKACSDEITHLDVVPSLIMSSHFRKELLKISSELDLHDDEGVRQALHKDEMEIANLLKELLAGNTTLPRLEGDDAERLMNLIHFVLDKGFWRQPLDNTLRRKAHNMLISLSVACNLVPHSLYVSGVELLEKDPICGGGFADVFSASYLGGNVALKRLRVHAPSNERQGVHRAFCREAFIWQGLRHPFVLPFLGVDAESFPSSLCLVMPWMQNGTIIKHLQGGGPPSVDVDKCILEVAQGIEYLHLRNIVHGDLRGMNILLDDEWHPRLADFGLTAFVEATMPSQSTSHRGSVRWMAPELHLPQSVGLEIFKRTPASDVYAFACVCVEIYTAKHPFTEFPTDLAVIFGVMNRQRPERPENCDNLGRAMSDTLWSIVQCCWAQSPSDRPSIASVVQALKTGDTGTLNPSNNTIPLQTPPSDNVTPKKGKKKRKKKAT